MIAAARDHSRLGRQATARSHAWLPRDQFDAVVEREGWVFARKGDGYLALRSQQPYRWQDAPGEDQGREIIHAAQHRHPHDLVQNHF